MPEIKVLIEGYAQETKDGWLASSTTVLVKDKNLNIIVDPGINRKLLVEALKKENLKFEDIDWALMTHYHPDHVFLSSLFGQAKFLDDTTIYEDDKEVEHEGFIPGTALKIIPTPGHAHEHCSLVVPTKKGMVVVAGDVFWWSKGEKQTVNLKKDDPFAKDKKALFKSRKKILKIADFIIPGHGKMFRVER